MEEKNEKTDISPSVKIPVSERFENFWYYYKWHTIIGIALLAVIIVLAVQLFTKTSYDVNIVYAGEKSISVSSSTGDGVTELSLITKAIESVAKDSNNDGKVRFSLRNLHILSAAELSEIKDHNKKIALESSSQSARQELRDIFYTDNFVFLLSDDVFKEYDASGDDSVFVDLSEYCKDGADYEFASERGVYVSSLPIYESTDLSLLPPDTVLCLRLPGVFSGRDSDRAYEAAKELVRSLLAFGN